MYAHLADTEASLIETRQLVEEVFLKNKTREFLSRGGEMTCGHNVDLRHSGCETLQRNLRYLYFERGMGYKLLSSSLGNISYTQLRTLFRKLGIEGRQGNSCITESLRKIRSERAKTNNPWKDWTGNPQLSQMHSKSKKYLGGWYFNESKQKNVWLRSSWEYAYARYLDDRKIDWDCEVRSYLLIDGHYYRPDFFIYENDRLIEVIEIKSTWSNGSLERIEKFDAFKKEYPQINSRLIGQELFLIVDKKQSQALLEWKKIRNKEIYDVRS